MKLSLEDNSRAFLREAVKNAIAAKSQPEYWQFALLHTVQALELSLKTLLSNIGKSFLYEDIDSPSHTVSLKKALARLENPLIGDMPITAGEKAKILSAVELRNRITHQEFEFAEEYALAKFCEVFAFVIYLQGSYLGNEPEDLLDVSVYEDILKFFSSRNELVNAAKRRIDDEGIRPEMVWTCLECSNPTFIIADGVDVCFVCRCSHETSECPHCEETVYSDDLCDFSDAFQEASEPFTHIANRFGFDDYDHCCRNCESDVRGEIEEVGMNEANEAAHFEHMAQEEAYWRDHGNSR